MHPAPLLAATWAIVLLPLSTASLSAQVTKDSSSKPDPVISPGDPSPFRRLDLPTANRIREGSGAPGPDYWQQRVDYLIRASLDTTGRSVSGHERITYYNRSPDTLRYLWIQLDQNLFTKSS